MPKKFTAKCNFGDQEIPVDLYVGDPAIGSHPLAFQAKWLSTTKRVLVPPQIMKSFAKLVDISERNRVPFEDLCEYVIAELRSASAIAEDAKKATAISNKKDNKNNEK
ncbi:MAG: DUF2610 domain-containing protein [Proteobacteria bacterium]|nr:DUF2610 domain-containing protein [Pseudomonadota bacterium]